MTNSTLPRVTHFEKCGKRALMVINPHTSCSSAIARGPCKFCAFWEKRPDGDGMLFEAAAARAMESRCARAEMLVPGSVFDSAQVSRSELEGMLGVLAALGPLTHILVETRPEYIDEGVVRFAVDSARGKSLEVAIGLETSDERTRDLCGKGFSIFQFHDAISVIAGAGAFPVAYLLAGYPEASKAAEGVLASAYLMKKLEDELRVRIRLAIQVYFPPKNGCSSLLTAATVAGMARAIRHDLGMEVFVATSTEGRSMHPLSRVRGVFEEFNDTQDPRILNKVLNGACRMPVAD